MAIHPTEISTAAGLPATLRAPANVTSQVNDALEKLKLEHAAAVTHLTRTAEGEGKPRTAEGEGKQCSAHSFVSQYGGNSNPSVLTAALDIFKEIASMGAVHAPAKSHGQGRR